LLLLSRHPIEEASFTPFNARADYLFASPSLGAVDADVFLEEFTASCGDYYLSDHFAVRAALAFEP